MPTAITQRFRRMWPFLTPGWRHTGDGGPELFSLTLLIDAFVQRMRSGLEMRLPSRAGTAANVLTAGDRGILRGRDESEADFIARLLAWRTPRTHLVRGNAYEALRQIWHYWGGIMASTIDAHGLTHSIDISGNTSRGTTGGWTTGTGTPGDEYITEWDGALADVDWARFWVVLQPPASMGIAAQPSLGDPELWGGSLGLPGHTLGQQGVTPADVLAMRTLFQDLNWHPGHTIPEWLILVFEGESLVVPSGSDDWTYWSKNVGGNQVPMRNQDQRYWALDPSSNRYSGLVTSFAETSDDVEGNTAGYGPGDETSFPLTSTLPDGATYGGGATVFPVNVQLLDDGSIPA